MNAQLSIKSLVVAWLLLSSSSLFAITFTYDPLNRLTQVTYANGSTISYTYDAAGNRLTYSGIATNGGDTVDPGISILSPTTGATYSTASSSVTLAGIASDNFGVSKITWQNDNAEIGIAIGTTNWTIPSLPLHPGENYFYVTAHDEAGNAADATLTVSYLAPPDFRITAFTINGSGVAQLAGVGPIGSILLIQTSTNLIHWETIGVLTNVTGTFQFPYPISASERKRFYRVAQGPPDMVWIAPGTFTMGSPETEQDRHVSEGPQTVVTLTQGFFMGKYLVTQALYEQVIGSNPSYFTGNANRPVEQVTWYDAVTYCEQWTHREQQAGRLPAGWVYRLPTEAEWEYACRAGTTTRFSFGDDPDYTLILVHEWAGGAAGADTTQPVGTKLPNPWGLYDMHGNVWEWCLDWYGWYPGGSAVDPTGPATGTFKVQRGGGFYNSGIVCRSASRPGNVPAYSYYAVGFRVVLALDQQ